MQKRARGRDALTDGDPEKSGPEKLSGSEQAVR